MTNNGLQFPRRAHYRAGGTFFKVGGHSGGMSQNILGGAQFLRGSVATEGQGRQSIFRIGGGGQKLEKCQNLQYNTLRA